MSARPCSWSLGVRNKHDVIFALKVPPGLSGERGRVFSIRTTVMLKVAHVERCTKQATEGSGQCSLAYLNSGLGCLPWRKRHSAPSVLSGSPEDTTLTSPESDLSRVLGRQP